MNTHRPGFTLIELLIVAVIAGLVMAAVTEGLAMQERTYRASASMIRGQDGLRTALGVLESELREVGSIGGAVLGGSDIAVATRDSVRFRAQRKIGFVCALSRNDRWILTWTHSDPFENGEQLLLFVDGDSLTHRDDRWDAVQTSGVASAGSGCVTDRPAGTTLQRVNLTGYDLTGVRLGAPVRSFVWTTYGIYSFGAQGWGLGRRDAGGQLSYLVGELAGPGQGLVFSYYTPTGAVTWDGEQVARIQIDAKTDPRLPGTPSIEHSTQIFLRNN
jgi:prepilin-type N-terminal cleavage/methylation domain-containing protein